MDLAHLGFAIQTAELRAAGAELDRLPGKAERVEKATDRMNRTIGASERLFRLARTAIVSFFGAFTIKALIDMTSAWTDLNSRVQIAVGSMEAGEAVMGRLTQMARRTYSSLGQTAETFLLNATAMRELGYSIDDTLDFVESVNNALVISGAKAERAESVVNALSKAMALGKLSGENLNVVIQSGGRVAEALAKSMGVTTNQLRQLGMEGKITGKEIFGITKEIEALREEADSMPATINDAFVLMGNAVLEFVGKMDSATGASSALAEAIINAADWLTGFGNRAIPLVVSALDLLYRHLDDLYDLFVVFVSAKIVLFLGSVAGAFITLARTVRTMGLVMAAVTAVTRVKITTLALLGAVVAKVTGTFDTFVGFIQDVGKALVEALPPELRDGIEGIASGLSDLLFDIDAVDSAASTSLSSYLWGAGEAANSLGTASKNAKNAIEDMTQLDRIKAMNDNLRDVRETIEGGVSNAFSSLTKAIIRGEDAVGALLDAVGRLGDRLIDMAFDQMIQGLFGNLFGLFGGAGLGSGAVGRGVYGGSGGFFPAFPGFAAGGFTGNSTTSRIAGVVHGGEYVFSAAATRRIGVDRLEGLHQRARGYATGGFVAPAANTNAPIAANDQMIIIGIEVSVRDDGKLAVIARQEGGRAAQVVVRQTVPGMIRAEAPAAMARAQRDRLLG